MVRLGAEEFQLSHESWPASKLIGASERLEKNLMEIVNLVSGNNAGPLLMTYASRASNYRPANTVIRKVARMTQTPFVDIARVFRSPCREIACPGYLFSDHHPKVVGYQLVAETLAKHLRTVMALASKESAAAE